MSALEGKVVVVTGAAGAIGRAAITALKAEGAVVTGVDLRAADDTEADHFVTCDLTREDEVADLYDGVAARFGRIDGLFNNAGAAFADDGSTLDVDVAVFERTLQVNVTSVLLCCKHGIPHLVAGGGGSVVNTASLVARMGSAVSQIGYTASKGAVVALSRELGVELARRGVRVNSLSPGPVASPMLEALFSADDVARRMVHIPAGRFGTAEEMARAALFLLSDASSFVNGIELVVDGGISAAYVTPED
ncbi:NAD(P)-dependent dehydrogenase (short-subunit alcohol dehydrogenase family) [Nocardioides aromaticivorans]|uniref:NAD(P)-dependent dehydrogenase (Short-subunit alcohol dehydrogenase family) n=1 Tax=Nocardioides aromaticivorans TaxID=200618 RepID=A0A7Y9ZHD3_9ACTN|nr:SDR family oxidoreductase [Nocardioides aromaticivorans]NYI44538.1 NAD(P)-dependent dehydrogenase (short-subunit alcohol dehydrogenase family) [Nocardioides aromaticivorans]